MGCWKKCIGTLLIIFICQQAITAQSTLSTKQSGAEKKNKKIQVVVLPSIGYTLQTSWAAVLSTNISFKSSNKGESTAKISVINGSINATIKKQIIVPIQASIWSKNGKWSWISDFRYMKYPSVTYGLGINTLAKDEFSIKYGYVKLHQTVLRGINKNLFIGGGIYYDRFDAVKQLNIPAGTITAFDKYGFSSSSSTTGPVLRILYDSRNNPTTPKNGWLINACIRNNLKLFGSNVNSTFLLFEWRKYFSFPKKSNNTLAIWNYYNYTLSGNPYYLMLPSTGWDDNYNTGRGYIQGRFRDKNMNYAESEYRFQLSKNEKWGGVIFVNGSSFETSWQKSFSKLAFGYGLGIRFQLNKTSKTNLCVDYAWGREHSHGIFVNIGEVF